jgi:hypothetical protein
MMNNENRLVRPATLVEGFEYLLNERPEASAESALVQVRFIAYCSSPAFVIVSNGNGKLRCSRDHMFLRA